MFWVHLISLWVCRHLNKGFIQKPGKEGRALCGIIYTLIWSLFAARYHLGTGALAERESYTEFWTCRSLSFDRAGSDYNIEFILHPLAHALCNIMSFRAEPSRNEPSSSRQRDYLWFMHTDGQLQGSSLGTDYPIGQNKESFLLHWVESISNLILLWAEVYVLDVQLLK